MKFVIGEYAAGLRHIFLGTILLLARRLTVLTRQDIADIRRPLGVREEHFEAT